MGTHNVVQSLPIENVVIAQSPYQDSFMPCETVRILPQPTHGPNGSVPNRLVSVQSAVAPLHGMTPRVRPIAASEQKPYSVEIPVLRNSSSVVMSSSQTAAQ